MIRSAEAALRYAVGLTQPAFEANLLVSDAVSWRLIVIGEAAGRLSQQARDQVRELPWRQIIGMRNRLVHEYDSVRIDIVWGTIQSDLPVLIEALRRHFPQADSAPDGES
jgi:uncharacterized protein with HEPN domain